MGNHDSGITVGDLKRQLAIFPDDMTIHMGGLTFYRLKQRGEKLLQIEFNEIVYLGDDGKVHVEDPDHGE